MFRTDKDELTIEELRNFVEAHKNKLAKFKLLQKYYEGHHRTIEDFERDIETVVKVVNPYPKYITDMLTGYFLGQPVKYAAIDKDTAEDDNLLNLLNEIYKYNDEQEENLELGKTCSIKGEAVEILWNDSDSNIRFKNLQPDEAFAIYDNTLECNIKFGVRLYNNREGLVDVEYVEVSDDRTTKTYKAGAQWLLVDERAHFFKDVPFVYYENNAELLGDWENIIPLIDAYDKAQTNTLRDMDDFTDAFLVLINMSGTTREDVKKAKREKVLMHEADGDAKWLIKDVNDSWVENYKNRLNHDIHKFSCTPDLNDENFGSNLSGVSLRYKLLAMEQIRSVKERKFKKGLQRRIELICNNLSYKDKQYDFTGIAMQFNNTLPQNVLEIAQIIQTLSPYLSKETLISMLPGVENAKDEIDKKESEEETVGFEYEELAKLLERKPNESAATDDEDGK